MPRHAMGDYAWYIVGQVMKLPVLSAINDNIRWHIMPSSNSNSSSTSNFQLSSSSSSPRSTFKFAYKFNFQVRVQLSTFKHYIWFKFKILLR